MHTTDALEAAGRRAALGPVPSPPTIDALVAEVDRRRSKRRRVVGGAAAAIVAAVAIPVGVVLIDGGQADVVTLASDDVAESLSDAPASLASQPEPSPTSAPTTNAVPTTEVPPSSPQAEESIDRGPLVGLSDEDFDLRLELGGQSFAIAVLHGAEALSRADDAAAFADETRDIDGQTVWLDEQGDTLVASALIDGEMFVQVTGPRDQLEQILDLVTEHANGPLRFFDLDGAGILEKDFPFTDGDLPFLEGGALEEFRDEMENFSDCLEITVDRSGSTTMVEIPDCDLPEFEGMFGDVLNDFPFDLEGLFNDLGEAGAN